MFQDLFIALLPTETRALLISLQAASKQISSSGGELNVVFCKLICTTNGLLAMNSWSNEGKQNIKMDIQYLRSWFLQKEPRKVSKSELLCQFLGHVVLLPWVQKYKSVHSQTLMYFNGMIYCRPAQLTKWTGIYTSCFFIPLFCISVHLKTFAWLCILPREKLDTKKMDEVVCNRIKVSYFLLYSVLSKIWQAF